MYLGSMEPLTDEHPVINSDKIEYSKHKYSIASQQLFYEIIQNSIDNYTKRGRPKNYYIDIQLSEREFTIRNNGRIFGLENTEESFNDVDRIVS